MLPKENESSEYLFFINLHRKKKKKKKHPHMISLHKVLQRIDGVTEEKEEHFLLD